ncbi:ubiquinol oxidase subunit II [Uliginosibacterium sp. H1]|uniref:ubiquinol oxidase subunit II n=1 Tax=Uliginosibacterium sp. H1 TaxID=3114757 RepID=UPI002E178131|nr:ubiquinol oxidase subunit II [Uliginosibacterium sp. H1]
MLPALLSALFLGGCDMVVMNPSGDIAAQQADLIVTSTLLMLLIIVPVIALTLLFAWRYRESNKEATYSPDWDHSTRLELVIWGAPLLIIIALGALTWISTHKLDPWRPLERIDATRALDPQVKPMVVQVVALDWKWLFLYPEQGIATVNEMAVPVDRPIQFQITSSTVMNAFYVPALAGMIYAMPGMETKLHAVINRPGVYDGFSANFSGDGFSHMRFKFHGLSDAGFERWVEAHRKDGEELNRKVFLQLEQPSTREPVRRFGNVDPKLFEAIVNRCVDASKMCMSEMMAIDAAGGMGRAGLAYLESTQWRGGTRLYVGAALCTPDNPSGAPLPVTAGPLSANTLSADPIPADQLPAATALN